MTVRSSSFWTVNVRRSAACLLRDRRELVPNNEAQVRDEILMAKLPAGVKAQNERRKRDETRTNGSVKRPSEPNSRGTACRHSHANDQKHGYPPLPLTGQRRCARKTGSRRAQRGDCMPEKRGLSTKFC